MADVHEAMDSGNKNCLHACLRALQEARTDTEKFALLLVLAKGVRAAQCTTQDREHILDAVGVPFFIRLLQTKQVPEGCSPFIYKSLATSILAALLEDCHMASCIQIKQIVPHLKNILELPLTTETDEGRTLVGDTCAILSRMASTEEGSRMLLDSGYPTLLVQILHNQPNEETFVRTQVLLILLQRQFRAVVWSGNTSPFNDYLTLLMVRLTNCEDRGLWDMCKLTSFVLSCAPTDQRIGTGHRCVPPLMSKLYSLLSSKLSVSQRQTVLNVVNHLVLYFDVVCLLPPVVCDDKFFQLVLSLTCIEVRMAVENTSFDQLQSNVSDLSLHYSTLEMMLDFLCRHDDDHELPLDATSFIQAHDALLSAANGIFFFLQQVESGAADIPLLHPVVVTSVRMIMTVTRQAFTEVKQNFIQVLPFLMKIYEFAAGKVMDFTADFAPYQTDDKSSTVPPMMSSWGAGSAVQPVADTDRMSGSSVTTTKDKSMEEQSRKSSQECVSSDEAGGNVKSPSELCDAKSDVADVVKDGQQQQDISDEFTGLEISLSGATQTGACGGSQDLHSASAKTETEQSESNEEELIMPKKIADLLKFTEGKSGMPSIQPVEVMKILLPVFHYVSQDEDTRRVFVEREGHTAFVQFLLQMHLKFLAGSDSPPAEDQLVLCQVLEVLVQLVMADETLADTEPFSHLLDIALTAVPELGDTAELYVYSGFLMAAGLTLIKIKGVHQNREQRESIDIFLQKAITYICQVPTAMFVTDPASAGLQHHWQNIEDIWALSIDNLSALLPAFPALVDLFLELEFIHSATKILSENEGHMKTENIPVIIEFLEVLASTDVRARKLLKEHNGIKLARTYGRQELGRLLQTV